MLEAQGVSKAFGGVVALRDAAIAVEAGSVHALLGENGAGKSTLVKILVGALRPDAGVLRLDGSEVSFSSTAEAAAHGVAVVSQELTLFPELDLLANLFPMREPRRGPLVSRSEMERRAEPILAALGLDVSPRRLVGTLSLADRQLVEVAKALVVEPRVLILDEPTSALEASGAERLLGVLSVLRERNVAVVFVSHILEEVMSLCDQVTVLRDGKPVLRGARRAELTIPMIVEAMLGERDPLAASSGPLEPVAARSGEPRPGGELRFDDVTAPGALDGVSFVAGAGEVVGLAGLVGSGHQAVLETIAGLRRPARGRVVLPDGGSAPASLRKAILSRVALVTGDRRRLGLMLDKSVWENVGQVGSVAIGRGGSLVRASALRARARGHVERLRIQTGSVDFRAGGLSGGNQQKVVFAKWLEVRPSVLLLDDPTRGVDVGAKAEMHALIRSVARSGAVVLLRSTEIGELAEFCDRVLVFYRSRICAELSGRALAEHAILEAMNTGAAPPVAARTASRGELCALEEADGDDPESFRGG